jgi:hypothetical protein
MERAAASEGTANIDCITRLIVHILGSKSAHSFTYTFDEKTYSRSSEMKCAPFGTVAGLRQQKLGLSSYLPSLKIRVRVFVLSLELVPTPFDLAMGIPADPAAIDIHVDIYFNIALDVNCDV